MADNEKELKELYGESEETDLIGGNLALTSPQSKNKEPGKVIKIPKNSNFCAYVIMMIDITLFIQLGTVITSLNPATPALKSFFNQTYQNRYNEPASSSTLTLLITLTQSMVMAGAIIGSLMTKVFAAAMSRLGALASYHLITLLSIIMMGVVTYYAMSYELMIAGRFINGFARGFGMNVVPLLVAELTRVESLTIYQSPPGWLMSAGCILGNILGHPKVLGGETTWPILVSVPAIFSIVYLLHYPFLPHSAIHWIRKNNKEKAMESLRRIRDADEESLQQEYAAVEGRFKQTGFPVVPVRELLLGKQHREQLIMAVILMFNLQTVGYSAIMLYSDSIFIAAGIPPDKATYASIGVFAEAVILSILGTFVMKKISLDKLLIIGNCIIIFATALLCVSIATQNMSDVMPVISIIAVVIYMFGNGVGPLLVSFALVVDVTTPYTRPVTLVVGGTVFWVTSWLVGFTAPFLLGSIGAYTWLIYCFITIANTIYFGIYLKQTLLKVSKYRKGSVMPPNGDDVRLRLASI